MDFKEYKNNCNQLKKIGFNKYESHYYTIKSKTCRNKFLGKDVKLFFLIFDESIENNEKIKKIRELIPEGEIYSKLKKMNISNKDIQQYIKTYNCLIRSPKKISLLEKEVNNLWDNHPNKSKPI